MGPHTRINDQFNQPDGTNLNDYANWTAYQDPFTPTDNVVFNDNVPEFTDPGGKVFVKPIPEIIYPSSDVNCIGDFNFFNSDVVDVDISFILMASSGASRSDLFNTGLRLQILFDPDSDTYWRLRLYNGNTLINSATTSIIPDLSSCLFQLILNTNDGYTLIFSQHGASYLLSGTLPNSDYRSGRFFAFITNHNGVVSGTDESWTTIIRLFLNETLHGSQSIQGVVYRRNQPLAGARVTCVTHDDDSFCGRATTDSDGKYRFSNLRSGVQYDLLASYTMGSGAYSAYPLPGVVPRFIPDP